MKCKHEQQEVTVHGVIANQYCLLCKERTYRWNTRSGMDIVPIDNQGVSEGPNEQDRRGKV